VIIIAWKHGRCTRHRPTLRGQLTQRGTHKHPQTPVRRPDDHLIPRFLPHRSPLIRPTTRVCNQPPRPASPAQVPQSVSQHRRPAATRCSTRSYPAVGTEGQPSGARPYTEPSGSVPVEASRLSCALRFGTGPLTGILRLTIRDRPWPGSPHASPPICGQLPVCRSAVRTAPKRADSRFAVKPVRNHHGTLNCWSCPGRSSSCSPRGDGSGQPMRRMASSIRFQKPSKSSLVATSALGWRPNRLSKSTEVMPLVVVPCVSTMT
jgi:hypothetical protein